MVEKKSNTSSVEKRMFLVSERDNTGISYNLSFTFNIDGSLNIALFWDAFSRVLARHSSLRKSFFLDDDNSISAVIHDSVEYKKNYIESKEEDLDKILADSETAFDLSKAPLFSVLLIKISSTRHVFYISIHHSIFDGFSIGILLRDLLIFYDGELPKPLLSGYDDFVENQNDFKINFKAYKKQEKFWKSILGQANFKHNFPYKSEVKSYDDCSGDEFYVDIDPEIIDRVKVIARNNKVSVFTVLFSVYHILLSKFAKKKDEIVSCIFSAGRTKHTEELIGMFVNTLPVKTVPEPSKHYLSYMQEVSQNIKSVQDNQEFQIEDIIDTVGISDENAGNPLFEFGFNLVRVEAVASHDLNVSFYEKCSTSPPKTSRFNLHFQIIRNVSNDDSFRIFVVYKTALLNLSTVRKFVDSYLNILSQVAVDPNRLIGNFFLDKRINLPKLSKTTLRNIYTRVSARQREIYLSSEVKKLGTAFNITLAVEVNGRFDKELLGLAIDNIISHHTLLRTYFMVADGEILQCIDDNFEYTKKYKTIDSCDLKKEINSFVKPFDFSKAPLFRFKLLNIAQTQNHVLLFDIHPIICDKQSAVLLCKEVFEYYNSKKLSPIDIQFKDYVFKQNQATEWDEFKLKNNYWISKLKGSIAPLEFPLEKVRKQEWDYAGDEVRFVLDMNMRFKLVKCADSYNIDIETVLLTAFCIFLSKYSNQEDVLIGVYLQGRINSETENMIGLFQNYLPFLTNIDREKSISELFEKVLREIVDIKHNQSTYFNRFAYELGLRNEIGRNPIFDFAFTYIYIDGFGRGIDITFPNHGTSRFDLSLNINDYHGKLNICFNFKTSLFNKKTIKQFFGHYQAILEQIAGDGDGRDRLIKEIKILTDSEYETIIYDWNSRKSDYPKDKTIQELFEEQVVRTPNKTALVFNNNSLSYQQLNILSNQLAYLIQTKYKQRFGCKIRKDTLIGIYLDRSLDMIVGILAILKSGAAYVPFDVFEPKDRLELKISDCECGMLVTSLDNAFNLNDIQKDKMEILCIDSVKEEILSMPSKNLQCKTKSTDLAYVIYTSGSTGKPKGVMLEHYGVSDMCNMQKTQFELSESSRVLQFASVSFDASVWDIFPALLVGATLYVADNDIRKDAAKLYQYLKDRKITHVTLAPVIFTELQKSELPDIEYIMTAGDVCSKETMDFWSKQAVVINAYGPTETTICATFCRYQPEKSNRNIGSAIDNKTVYVLNKDLKPVPFHVAGELYIGGEGLARGYFKREELTAERFIKNLYATEKDIALKINQLIYKSGDLVKWLEDGDLIFLGRNDFQVKINGFRIELGEIEALLMEFEEIEQCIVVAYDNRKLNTKQIAAYYQSDNEIDSEILRAMLSEKLPHYMIPSFFIWMREFHLNTSGKINRHVLPDPVEKCMMNSEYVAPETEIEKYICGVFQEILKADKVGIKDNFFSIGGNSLKAVALASRLQKKLNITVADLFVHSSVEEIVKNIELVDNNLEEKFLKIKKSINDVCQMYNSNSILETIRDKKLKYENSNKKYDSLNLLLEKDIKGILLTGATGYLGVHILKELITTRRGKSKIYCIIRGKDNKDAFTRLINKINFYFGEKLLKELKDHVVVFCGDISQALLGVTDKEYSQLAKNVDSIIHAAANVSHYGEYDVFYNANVLPVEQLVKLAKTDNKKDLHYISTRSVCDFVNIPNKKFFIVTDNDDISDIPLKEHVYVKTKLEGEQVAIKAREQGINTSIYRVGNLVFNSETGKNQENLEDNGFYQILKSFINIGYVPDVLDEIEMSHIDYTAKAICSLYNKQNLQNEIFHVYNPNKVKLSEMLVSSKLGLNIENMPFDKFIDFVFQHYDKKVFAKLIENLMLHFGWLDEDAEKTQVLVFQGKTEGILKKIGFSWKHIASEDFMETRKYALSSRTKWLSELPLLNGIGESLILNIAYRTRLKCIGKDEHLIKEGYSNDKVFFIINGILTESKKSIGGWEGVLRLIQDKTVLGLDNLASNKAIGSIEGILDDIIYLEMSVKEYETLISKNMKLMKNTFKLQIEEKNNLKRMILTSY